MTPNLLGACCAAPRNLATAPRSGAGAYSHDLSPGKAASDGFVVPAGTTASRAIHRSGPDHTAKAIGTVANLLCGPFPEFGKTGARPDQKIPRPTRDPRQPIGTHADWYATYPQTRTCAACGKPVWVTHRVSLRCVPCHAGGAA